MGYDVEEIIPEFSPKRQWIGAVIASLGIFAAGTVLGWSSPSNPDLEESQDLGALSKSQLSWIASISLLAALTSCFLIGYTVERIGRKLTSIIMVVPFVIGYAIMAASQNVGMIIAGRFITGFSAGAYTVITSVYINEITQDKMRNMLGTVMVVFLCSGITFVYVVGAITTWRVNSIACGIVPIVHGVLMFFMPDTPRYLVSKGKIDEAAKSLQWLRGASSTSQVEHELKDIQDKVEESNKAASAGGSIFVASAMKPSLLSVAAMAFQQLAGINAVIFFSVDIFKSAGSDLNPKVCAIIVGATQSIGFAGAAYVTEKFGRKPLFFVSEVGMCICLTALGVFYYLKEHNPDTADSLGWLPLVSLIMYMVTYCIGVGPYGRTNADLRTCDICLHFHTFTWLVNASTANKEECQILPWTLMGDLCPPQIKGFASAMTTSTNWGLGFLVAFTFQNLIDAIESYGAFWIFAGVCALGSAFALFILPETKGKSVEEIMRLFA